MRASGTERAWDRQEAGRQKRVRASERQTARQIDKHKDRQTEVVSMRMRLRCWNYRIACSLLTSDLLLEQGPSPRQRFFRRCAGSFDVVG